MNPLSSLFKRHALTAFFVLAFAFFWIPVPLASITPVLPVLIGLFGPALAAIIVTSLTEGQSGVKSLLKRLGQWRVGLGWYVITLGFPIAVGLAAVAISAVLGSPTARQIGPFSAFAMILGILIFGEELGWRGYAFPRLQARYGALPASLIFGLVHAIWHLPYLFFIRSQDLFGAPFLAYWIMTMANAIVLTWILNHTQGSVLIATLYHAAFNATGFLYVGIASGLSVEEYWWMRAAVYAGAAIIVLLVAGLSLARPILEALPDGRAVATSQPPAP